MTVEGLVTSRPWLRGIAALAVSLGVLGAGAGTARADYSVKFDAGTLTVRGDDEDVDGFFMGCRSGVLLFDGQSFGVNCEMLRRVEIDGGGGWDNFLLDLTGVDDEYEPTTSPVPNLRSVVVRGGQGKDDLDDLGALGVEFYGGGDADQAVMGGGHDIVHGGQGDDEIKVEEGDDIAEGGAGNDVILGGSGNDNLSGDGGRDSASGGRGKNDRCRAEAAAALRALIPQQLTAYVGAPLEHAGLADLDVVEVLGDLQIPSSASTGDELALEVYP